MGVNHSKLGQEFDEACLKLVAEDLFNTTLYKKLRDPTTNKVSLESLLKYASTITDVFITHNWSPDSYDRDNHERVYKIVKIL